MTTLTARQRILQAALEIAGSTGLTECSVEQITTRAGCAKGLINYHFGSKDSLLAEAARTVREHRLEARLCALSPGGTDGLDGLWRMLVAETRTGEAAAWLGLVAHPATRSHAVFGKPELARLHQAAARALGFAALAPAMEMVTLALDGIQLSLLAGAPAGELRESYDMLWLALLKADD